MSKWPEWGRRETEKMSNNNSASLRSGIQILESDNFGKKRREKLIPETKKDLGRKLKATEKLKRENKMRRREARPAFAPWLLASILWEKETESQRQGSPGETRAPQGETGQWALAVICWGTMAFCYQKSSSGDESTAPASISLGRVLGCWTPRPRAALG